MVFVSLKFATQSLKYAHKDTVCMLCVHKDNAELLAYCRAVHLAQELNVQRVVLETDSQTAVRKINDEATILSIHGHLVQEVEDLLKSFEDYRIVWV